MFRTLESFRETMDTGIPELGVPPIDPIHLKLIDFKFYNLTVEFFDVNMFGFKGFSLKSSNVDKKKRYINNILSNHMFDSSIL